MFRFYLPQTADPEERIQLLHEQFDAFLQSDALRELFALLHTDAVHFRGEYDGRNVSGGVRKTRELIGILDWIDRFSDNHIERRYV